MPKPLATASLAAAGCLAAVLAERALAADDQPGRYTMNPAEGGVVRLDKETGAMSFCSGKEGDWVCKPMPDAEQSLKRRIDDLESENKALKDERRSATGPGSEPAPLAGDPPPPGDLPMPTERDVDKLFDYVEGMVKKFKERIERLEKEAQKEQTPL